MRIPCPSGSWCGSSVLSRQLFIGEKERRWFYFCCQPVLAEKEKLSNLLRRLTRVVEELLKAKNKKEILRFRNVEEKSESLRKQPSSKMFPKGLRPTPTAFVVLLTILPNVNSFRDTEVQITSDGPAVLDSTITFQAKLINSESYSGPFYFRWSKSTFSFVLCSEFLHSIYLILNPFVLLNGS